MALKGVILLYMIRHCSIAASTTLQAADIGITSSSNAAGTASRQAEVAAGSAAELANSQRPYQYKIDYDVVLVHQYLVLYLVPIIPVCSISLRFRTSGGVGLDRPAEQQAGISTVLHMPT